MLPLLMRAVVCMRAAPYANFPHDTPLRSTRQYAKEAPPALDVEIQRHKNAAATTGSGGVHNDRRIVLGVDLDRLESVLREGGVLDGVRYLLEHAQDRVTTDASSPLDPRAASAPPPSDRAS